MGRTYIRKTDFLSNYPGRVITLYDNGSLFDADFETAKTTDRDKVVSVPTLDIIELNLSNLQPETEVVEATHGNQPLPSTSKILPDESQSVSTLIPRTLEAPRTSNKENSNKELISGLPTLPRADSKVRRPRKKLPSFIISSTPVKDALKQKEFEKQEKEKKKLIRGLQQTKNKKVTQKMVKELERKKPELKKTNKNTKRQIKFDDSSDSTSSTEIPCVDTEDDMDLEVEDDDKTCIICGDIGKDNELWFQCFASKLWAHTECTELSSKEAKFKKWQCYPCVN